MRVGLNWAGLLFAVVLLSRVAEAQPYKALFRADGGYPEVEVPKDDTTQNALQTRRERFKMEKPLSPAYRREPDRRSLNSREAEPTDLDVKAKAEVVDALIRLRKALETIQALKDAPDTGGWANAELAEVEKQLQESEQALYDRLESAENPEPAAAQKYLASRLVKRADKLELLVAADAERSLELKLLRLELENTKTLLTRDLENANQVHTAGLAAVKESVDRVYDWVKWLFGGGVGLALLLLALKTFQSASKQPKPSPPEQEDAA